MVHVRDGLCPAPPSRQHLHQLPNLFVRWILQGDILQDFLLEIEVHEQLRGDGYGVHKHCAGCIICYVINM